MIDAMWLYIPIGMLALCMSFLAMEIATLRLELERERMARTRTETALWTALRDARTLMPPWILKDEYNDDDNDDEVES